MAEGFSRDLGLGFRALRSGFGACMGGSRITTPEPPSRNAGCKVQGSGFRDFSFGSGFSCGPLGGSWVVILKVGL